MTSTAAATTTTTTSLDRLHTLSSSSTKSTRGRSSSSASSASSSSSLTTTTRRILRNRQKKSSPISSSSSLKGLTEEIAQLGLDLDRNTVGPAVFALSAVSVFWLFYDGSVQTKQLKEELDARGVDSSLFNKLYELKYIKRALDSGDRSAYDEAEEKIQWQRSKIVVGAGSITEVQKIQKFWQSKGIKVKTLADLDKVEEYMVKKYGGKKSKFWLIIISTFISTNGSYAYIFDERPNRWFFVRVWAAWLLLFVVSTSSWRRGVYRASKCSLYILCPFCRDGLQLWVAPSSCVSLSLSVLFLML